MTIEGLGKKFQEARLARKLTLDEAARMTKIRPSRLAEIEADDFSQFPSLAYAKGFILIYGKFLDVDVTSYMEAFEGAEGVTVDGYSYLQENPAPAPVRTRVVRHRPAPSSSGGDGGPTSLMPLVIGVVVLIVGFMAMRFIMNVQRIATHNASPSPTASVAPAPSIAPTAAAPASTAVAQATKAPVTTPAPVAEATSKPVSTAPPATPPPAATAAPSKAPVVAAASTSATAGAAAKEPEVRKAEPVKPEELKKESPTAEKSAEKSESPAPGSNSIAIRPLKSTYLRVTVDGGKETPVLERWISPNDKPLTFSGQHVSIRVVDRTAVQIKKNGKPLTDGDPDVTIE